MIYFIHFDDGVCDPLAGVLVPNHAFDAAVDLKPNPDGVTNRDKLPRSLRVGTTRTGPAP